MLSKWRKASRLALALIVALLAAAVAAPALAAGSGSGGGAKEMKAPATAQAEKAPAAPAAPGQLTLDLTNAGGKATAKAVLKDASGKPVRSADVDFVRKTTFGQLDLGTARTGFDGEATMTFAVYPGQNVQVTAKYGGGPAMTAAQAQAQFALAPAPIPRVFGIYSELPNPWFIVILVVVVGGVWTTYGLVFRLVRKIRAAGNE